MPTRVLAYWANKASRLEIDIDASHRVTAIRLVGDVKCTGRLGRADGSRTYAFDRTLSSQTIATTTGARVQLTYDAARDRYSGLAGEILND